MLLVSVLKNFNLKCYQLPQPSPVHAFVLAAINGYRTPNLYAKFAPFHAIDLQATM